MLKLTTLAFLFAGLVHAEEPWNAYCKKLHILREQADIFETAMNFTDKKVQDEMRAIQMATVKKEMTKALDDKKTFEVFRSMVQESTAPKGKDGKKDVAAGVKLGEFARHRYHAEYYQKYCHASGTATEASYQSRAMPMPASFEPFDVVGHPVFGDEAGKTASPAAPRKAAKAANSAR